MLRAALPCALALLLGSAGPVVQAQLLIGQPSGFTGPVAPGVQENTTGAKLYIDAVNARGGVHGERIELVSVDDKFDPKLTAALARTLIVERNVLALFLNRGTPHTQALMPLLTEFKVPLVAPSTGAMVLHEPVHPWVFNVRATYQRESERAVAHLDTIGFTRIAVVHVDDSFGQDVLQGALKGFAAARKEPLFVEKFDREKWDFSKIAPRVAAAGAQAVLLIGSAATVADGVAAIRAAGSRAQVITNSNNASAGFIRLLKEHAPGVIITQVFPNERSMAAPLVKEAIDLARARGVENVSPAMLEGFAAAKVLVAGLRRAGPAPTRARLRDALESLVKLDLGGLELTYGPNDHTGLEFVDLSIIGTDGKLKR